MAKAKRVLVIIRRPPDDAKAAQGLRAAVAYAALDLDVTVALCAGEHEAGGAASRPLTLLSALGHSISTVDAEALCALLCRSRFDAVVVW